MLPKVMLGLAGTLALAGAYVVHEGAVRISVDESPHEGKETHIHLLVPAVLVPAALHFVPDNALANTSEKLRAFLPAIRVAAGELQRHPDCDLLEVKDGEKYVHIYKRGNALVVDAQEPEEDTHISVPLPMVEKIARNLESRAPRS